MNRNRIIIFLMGVLFALQSCTNNEELIGEIKVINDVVYELLDESFFYESYDEYVIRTGNKDSLSFDKSYSNFIEKRRKKTEVKICIQNTLEPIEESVLNIINDDLLDIGKKKSLRFVPNNEIEYGHNVKIINKEQKSDGLLSFSRVYFTPKNKYAYFIYRFTDLDGKYSKYLIKVNREGDSWKIRKMKLIGTA
ncbi:hypothetical protein SAMN04487906_1161 [Zhouia amylolytica]|uniref:Uncharacterized protein n=1 Tax=Zhouia amylolytica TaxID=376730 RepID=A0A1I6RM47_9FLAO|nr:hypothetical protein [Zhouia amylolytica]SFS65716.1 hypothetical protein SAMN04487906_1161 [Zhouia amylolytica]